MANSILVTDSSKEIMKMLYIYYLVWFQENQIKTLLNSGNKIKTISLCYTKKWVLKILKTNIKTQKIDSSTLKTFKIVIINFKKEDKIGRPRFFQKKFLVVNIKFEVILGMPFLKISNINVLFGKKIFT